MPSQDPTTVKLLTLLNVSSLRSSRRSLKANTQNGHDGDVAKRRKLGGKLLASAQPQTATEADQDEESEVESDEEDVVASNGMYDFHISFWSVI